MSSDLAENYLSATNHRKEMTKNIKEMLVDALVKHRLRSEKRPTKVRISKLTAWQFEKLGHSEIGDISQEFFLKGAENVFKDGKCRPFGLDVIVEECTADDIKIADNGEYRFNFE